MARRVSHFYNERALTMKERAIRCLLAPRFSTSQLFPQKTYTVVRMYVFASFVLSAFIYAYVLHTTDRPCTESSGVFVAWDLIQRVFLKKLPSFPFLNSVTGEKRKKGQSSNQKYLWRPKNLKRNKSLLDIFGGATYGRN